MILGAAMSSISRGDTPAPHNFGVLFILCHRTTKFNMTTHIKKSSSVGSGSDGGGGRRRNSTSGGSKALLLNKSSLQIIITGRIAA